MRTTATDSLEAHANLLPPTLLLQNACHRAILRLASHPKSHPLFIPVRNAAKRYVSSHRTSLHRLTHRFEISPQTVETLIPARRSPTSKNPWNSHIAPNKEQAIAECEVLTDQIQIFSDGSGHKGNIGAAAVLFRAGKAPRTLRYHLGTEDEHTVFEAEEIGLILAARLLATEQDPPFPISILVDNQASIQAGESFYTRPGSYLADRFRRMMQQVAKDHDDFDVTLRWIPGHSNVHGNEEADKHAKLAAEGRHNNSPPDRLPRSLRHQTLPLSVSALKERQGKDTAERWKHIWHRSPRYYHMNRIDPNILKRSFIKLTSTFSKRLTSLYVFLRTGHAPLNQHLHRIRKSDSSSCPHCPETEETVHHYLLTCPHYRRERHLLNTALGQDSSSLSFLLTDPLATPHLVKFVNATGRMRAVLGEIPIPH
jgi:ribonuclease HI